MNAIRMIKMGNLAGNTVDAFISRLKGAPAPGSSVLWEAVFFLLSLPVTVPMLIKMRGSTVGSPFKCIGGQDSWQLTVKRRSLFSVGEQEITVDREEGSPRRAW
jgi:hypothetical protein